MTASLTLSRKASAGLLSLGMAATVGGALAFEHIGGYIPCALCLLQRDPYYYGIPVAVAALLSALFDGPVWLTRLLLADDDPVLLKSLHDLLEADGHFIALANSGAAGIAEFRAALERNEPYAAVITDLGMPYVDGRKVAEAVKQASTGTPVILLTGWGHRMVAEGEIPAHVDRVLAKPPRLREVREALMQLCASQGASKAA